MSIGVLRPDEKTYGVLDAERHAAFTRDLLALRQSHDHAGDSTLAPPSEYLEVVIERNHDFSNNHPPGNPTAQDECKPPRRCMHHE